MLHFLRTVRHNPIYLRESGQWGKPNHFFATLSRYSPFVVMLAVVVGMCSTSYGLPFLMVLNEELMLYWVLACLPMFLVQMLLLGALVTVPTLTTPLVSQEMEQGTWEMLRLTPQPMLDLLLAKLLGAMARLRWLWGLLLLGTVLQAGGAVLGALGVLAMAPPDTFEQINMQVVLLLLSMLLVTRPWAEIFFVALLGLLISTLVKSTRLGLALCYVTLFLFRTLNGNLTWTIVAGILSENFSAESAFAFVSLTPSLVYFLGTAVLLLLIIWRAHKLTMSHE
jgi:hypothetical protein